MSFIYLYFIVLQNKRNIYTISDLLHYLEESILVSWTYALSTEMNYE
tara:strand:- start:119482 stop:119622 length:141 start_codon:yes stop_codon:yes gene_type:complete